MKKYILIKWYPGLPVNATKAVQTSDNWYRITDDQEKTMFGSVTANTVEDSPEFWTQYPDVMPYLTLYGEKIQRGQKVWYAYENRTPNKSVWIYSFTVATEYSESDYPNVFFFATEEQATAFVQRMQPQPMFVAMDKIPVYPNTDFYVVDTSFGVHTLNLKKDEQMRASLKPFALQKNAHEWILQNKPLITLNDIMLAENTPYNINISDSNKGKFRALAQSRLDTYKS